MRPQKFRTTDVSGLYEVVGPLDEDGKPYTVESGYDPHWRTVWVLRDSRDRYVSTSSTREAARDDALYRVAWRRAALWPDVDSG